MPKVYAYILGLASVSAFFLVTLSGLTEREGLAKPRHVVHKAKSTPHRGKAPSRGKPAHGKAHPDLAHLPPMRLGGPLPVAAYASPVARPATVAATTPAATVATPPAAVKPVTSRPAPAPVAVAPRGKGGHGKAPPAPPSPPAPSDAELLREAQDAYIQGERQRAIDLAISVAEKDSPSSPAAWKFIGLAACSVRSLRLSTRAYQGVSKPADQKAIADACRVNGLHYQGDRFIEK